MRNYISEGSTSILGANVTFEKFPRDFQKDIFLNAIKCFLIMIKHIFGTVNRKETQEPRRITLVSLFNLNFTFQTGHWRQGRNLNAGRTCLLSTLVVKMSDFRTNQSNFNRYESPELQHKWTIPEQVWIIQQNPDKTSYAILQYYGLSTKILTIRYCRILKVLVN